MHIKTIRMTGFRSYRSQGLRDGQDAGGDGGADIEFSPQMNCVVGRNGAGKSNFFEAVRFVLGEDRYSKLKQQDRTALLHEGSGPQVLTGTVEIVFDNSDKRFPNDGDEVVIRRDVGSKKDEYYVNRKRVSQRDVASLLETAGFSKSNPYYIVQQGRVNQLCKMDDQQRLQLIKEVAGTGVYETRREESLRILDESKKKREAINALLTDIEERLHTLDREQKELRAFQRHDSKRRAIEFTLYEKELRSATAKLEEIQLKRNKQRKRIDQLQRKADAATEAVAARATEQDREQARLRGLEAELTTLADAIPDLSSRRVKAGVDLQAAEAANQRSQASAEELQARMAELESQLADARAQLDGPLRTRLEEARAAYAAAKQAFDEAEVVRESLYARAGRSARFKSKSSRDKFLRKELKQRQGQAQEAAQELERARKQLNDATAEAASAGARAEKQRAAAASAGAEAEALGERLRALESAVVQAAEERQQAADRAQAAADKVRELTATAAQERAELVKHLPRQLRLGVEAVRELVGQPGFEGVLGTILDLVTTPSPRIFSALEAIAGNQAFNVVVDNEHTAKRVILHLQKRRAGRVTLIPLARVSSPQVQFPQSPDVTPLMDRVACAEEVKPAVRQIFGKALLCRDLSTASKHRGGGQGITGVTLDGHKVESGGAMSGGFVTLGKTRFATRARLREAEEQLAAAEERAAEAQAATTAVSQRTTEALAAKRDTQSEQGRRRQAADGCRRDAERADEQALAAGQRAERLRGSVLAAEAAARRLESEVEQLQQELAAPMSADLSAADRERLQAEQAREPALQRALQEAGRARDAVEAEQQRVQNSMNQVLLRRIADTRSALQQLAGGGGGGGGADAAADAEAALQALREEDAAARRAEEAAMGRHAAVGEQVTACRDAVEAVEAAVASLREQESEERRALDAQKQARDKLLESRATQLRKKTEFGGLIMNLGTVSRADMDEHQGLSRRELMRQLKAVNAELEKFQHVNKKALDQYTNFSEQREDLQRRKKELDDGDERLAELVQHLDSEKEQAIATTFRGVQRHFRKVFSELVPNGKGSVEVVRSTDVAAMADDDDDDDVDEAAAAAGGGDGDDDDEDGEGGTQVTTLGLATTVGIRIKVGFTDRAPAATMQELSGGQQAIVALALLFAIQRCDPAPFYLFDEIDQALDASHRTAVAELIRRQAEDPEAPSQFVCTTFRPELVEASDRHFGIIMQHKESTIVQQSKAKSLEFVQHLQEEAERVGDS